MNREPHSNRSIHRTAAATRHYQGVWRIILSLLFIIQQTITVHLASGYEGAQSLPR